MDRHLIERYERKKVKLFLKDGDLYSGTVEVIGDDSLSLVDKFGLNVTINFDNIALIKEFAVKRR